VLALFNNRLSIADSGTHLQAPTIPVIKRGQQPQYWHTKKPKRLSLALWQSLATEVSASTFPS
jgi:hypothetical protein